jgi:hypothetical protein
MAPTGEGIIVKVGDPVGSRGGKVIGITREFLTVREFFLAPDGARVYEDRQMNLGTEKADANQARRIRFKPGEKEPELVVDPVSPELVPVASGLKPGAGGQPGGALNLNQPNGNQPGALQPGAQPPGQLNQNLNQAPLNQPPGQPPGAQLQPPPKSNAPSAPQAAPSAGAGNAPPSAAGAGTPAGAAQPPGQAQSIGGVSSSSPFIQSIGGNGGAPAPIK